MATNHGNTAQDNGPSPQEAGRSFFVSPSFGPLHPCRRCGVEIQLVHRAFGRSAFEEMATGRNHRYYCAGRDAETAAMIAKVMETEYMVETEAEAPAPSVKTEAPAMPEPKLERTERPPWSVR